MIRHVFFDLDHTLWDFEANAEKAYEICLKKHNITLEIKDFMAVYRPINHAYWKQYREEQVTKEELVFGRLQESFIALEYQVTATTIKAIAKDFLHYLPNFNRLFDGAVEILEYLYPKYQLHIITNGFNEVQMPKLKNSNILHFFDQIITAESAGGRKPNPKIFLYALEKANATSQESIMIGDSYEADIIGANRVNMRSILFEQIDSQYDTKTAKVSCLLQIKKYL